MSFSSQNGFDRNTGAIEAEKTLRRIASLPAPEGLAERVKAGLRSSARETQLIRWPLAAGSRNRWMENSMMRAAAAAAIVIAVTGGGWEVYSHIQVAPEPAAIAAPPRISGQSGFSTAATRRVPQTLEAPVVAVPVKETEKLDVHPTAPPSRADKPATRRPKAPVQVQP